MNLSLRRSFHPLGHSSPFAVKRDQNTILHPVKDLISLALTEKKGALEGLLILPRLIFPNNNMRGRTVVSKVLQNIGSFRKKECSKKLWNIPNAVLRYGSFNPVKRAEALARAGELGAAVRALTSEGVLDAKEHI